MSPFIQFQDIGRKWEGCNEVCPVHPSVCLPVRVTVYSFSETGSLDFSKF